MYHNNFKCVLFIIIIRLFLNYVNSAHLKYLYYYLTFVYYFHQMQYQCLNALHDFSTSCCFIISLDLIKNWCLVHSYSKMLKMHLLCFVLLPLMVNNLLSQQFMMIIFSFHILRLGEDVKFLFLRSRLDNFFYTNF